MKDNLREPQTLPHIDMIRVRDVVDLHQAAHRRAIRLGNLGERVTGLHDILVT